MSPSISSAPLSVPDMRLFQILLAITLSTTIFSKRALALKPASKPQEWIYKNSKGGWDHMELCFWTKTKWTCNMGVELPLMIPAIKRGPGNHTIQVTTPAPSKYHGSHHG
uniref:Uncharacterized protein n=1 Tax=Rhipicephalus zambeziensis TaxID=60191 RepID=A0A224Y6E6_9ACAR